MPLTDNRGKVEAVRAGRFSAGLRYPDILMLDLVIKFVQIINAYCLTSVNILDRLAKKLYKAFLAADIAMR